MGITRLITRFRISSAAIVAAIVTVAVVGPAAAEVWPEGRYGAKLSTQMSVPKTQVLAPDDTTRLLPERSSAAALPDFVDRYVQTHGASVVQATQPAASRSGEGFDWGAAGIGASTTAALLLVFGVGIVLTRRSRTRSAVA
jgi:hypothetical protein